MSPMTFEETRAWVARGGGDPNVCMCEADEDGRYIGWVPCPPSCCDRPDHRHERQKAMANEDRILVVSVIDSHGGVNSQSARTLDEVMAYLKEPTHLGGEPKVMSGVVTICAVKP